MGDASAEPSMEEILSSIKRIIAEEGDAPPQRRRSSIRPLGDPAHPVEAAPPAPVADDTEVLELNDPMPAAPARTTAALPAPPPTAARPPVSAPEPDAEPIVSQQAAAASRGALDSLSRLIVKPEGESDGTLEGLVREMLRPMLRDWLDANLPAMVEALVAKEIARISGQQ